MNSDLLLIYNEAKTTLEMNDKDVYGRIIDMMLEKTTNPKILNSFSNIKYQLDEKFFEEDKTPEVLSYKYLGYNVFVFDVFDYYIMVNSLTQDTLRDLFSKVHPVPSSKIGEVWENKYFLHKNNVLEIFDEKEKYMHRIGKNYPYKTILFQDFLDERKDWLIYLEKEMIILDEVLNG